MSVRPVSPHLRTPTQARKCLFGASKAHWASHHVWKADADPPGGGNCRQQRVWLASPGNTAQHFILPFPSGDRWFARSIALPGAGVLLGAMLLPCVNWAASPPTLQHQTARRGSGVEELVDVVARGTAGPADALPPRSLDACRRCTLGPCVALVECHVAGALLFAPLRAHTHPHLSTRARGARGAAGERTGDASSGRRREGTGHKAETFVK